MWRAPFLNLCFMLALITILILQHSAAVVGPINSLTGSTEGAPPFQNVGDDTSLGEGLKTFFVYLSDLEQRSRIIKDWYIESQSFSWQTIRLAPGTETDLVEARFHVANAEAVSAATGDTRRSEVELDRADGYLQHALKNISSDLQPFVRAIRIELTDTKAELEKGEPDTDIRDEQIKTDVDWILQALHDQRP